MGSEIEDNTTQYSSYPITGFDGDEMEKTTVTATDVRCFCNLPQCVPSGYMCKTQHGICFTKSSESQNTQQFSHKDLKTTFNVGSYVNKPIRGCVEMLPRIEQIKCKRKSIRERKSNESRRKYSTAEAFPETTTSMSPDGHTDSHEKYFSGKTNVVLECCARDVCNYEKVNSFYLEADVVSYDKSSEVPSKMPMWWAHTASFFVPVVGGLIFALFFLIFIAARMLRKESNGYRECMNDPAKRPYYIGPNYPFMEQTEGPILSAKSLQKENVFKISEFSDMYTSTMKKPRHLESLSKHIKFSPLSQLDQSRKPPANYPNVDVFNVQKTKDSKPKNCASRNRRSMTNSKYQSSVYKRENSRGRVLCDDSTTGGLTDSGISRCSSPNSELQSPCLSEMRSLNDVTSLYSRCTSPTSISSVPNSPINSGRMKFYENLTSHPDEVEPLA